MDILIFSVSVLD